MSSPDFKYGIRNLPPVPNPVGEISNCIGPRLADEIHVRVVGDADRKRNTGDETVTDDCEADRVDNNVLHVNHLLTEEQLLKVGTSDPE